MIDILPSLVINLASSGHSRLGAETGAGAWLGDEAEAGLNSYLVQPPLLTEFEVSIS